MHRDGLLNQLSNRCSIPAQEFNHHVVTGLLCGFFLRNGEAFAFVKRIQNLKDPQVFATSALSVYGDEILGFSRATTLQVDLKSKVHVHRTPTQSALTIKIGFLNQTSVFVRYGPTTCVNHVLI